MPHNTDFIRRVRLKNYRSIGECDVRLGPLNFLVGPNGSGKSNFLDALRFLADSLNQSLDHAIRDRGGAQEVRRRSGGHPNNFAVRVDFATAEFEGHHAFEVTASGRGAWAVRRERCLVRWSSEAFRAPDGFSYQLEGGDVIEWPERLGAPPPASTDRLFLVNAAGHAPFRAVFDRLTHMGFYNLNPGVMRALQPPDPGHLLKRDGANIASVLSHLDASDERKQRLVEYLGKVAPGIVGVEPRSLGPAETVEFRQRVHGATDPWRFLAQSMSDGTVRALGVLVALHQTGNGQPMPLVGIEEPETALHPAAAGVLLDALRDAGSRMQVIANTHSADLLADPDIDDASILAVTSEDNETRIGPIERVGREAMRERLFTAGELLREDRLQPDEEQSRPKQLRLFDGD
jgi:predicted ATPase